MTVNWLWNRPSISILNDSGRSQIYDRRPTPIWSWTPQGAIENTKGTMRFASVPFVFPSPIALDSYIVKTFVAASAANITTSPLMEAIDKADELVDQAFYGFFIMRRSTLQRFVFHPAQECYRLGTAESRRPNRATSAKLRHKVEVLRAVLNRTIVSKHVPKDTMIVTAPPEDVGVLTSETFSTYASISVFSSGLQQVRLKDV